ncbi:FAD/NAD(P)-binding protein [Sulfitobacter sp. F26204]|uniref:FAD/NAD(P)-binding protein n=1 Tax=Sulfitobacter sp. F26204 TaxID=2996014 RepID=UPI00225E204A|nr:FAD/NAD(P)-binding protein [Sulfitobacter sp. F26204]MCX7560272.1 FAD/NAD(P)-binding protein [Sulfitobacter sp. F26204]
MSTNKSAIKVAIIGMGPRGLGALEALLNQCALHNRTVNLSVFDPLDLGGAGPNFDPGQSILGLLNTPTRDVQLDTELILACGGFPEWQAGQDHNDIDRYAPRAELGSYLQQRFQDVVTTFKAMLTLSDYHDCATAIRRDETGWHVTSTANEHGPFDEILLVPGQPQTEYDAQWASWVEHSRQSDADCIQAYPDQNVLDAAKGWTGRKVGIRGLGLSTFDVLRYLTAGQGGRFEKNVYHKSGKEPDRIFAFSLNGQPPFPKPENARQDQDYSLQRVEIEQFLLVLKNAVSLPHDQALDHICDALVAPTFRIGSTMGMDGDVSDIRKWLQTERTSPGDQETHAPVDTLKQGIAMANGSVPPTIGYVIGQIWRKLQNELRIGFNSAQISPETARALIDLDEGLKRYAYGPPLSSACAMLALIDCGLVSLSVVDDPDVAMVDEGWQLFDDGEAATVSVMINAVLAPPSLQKITDPFVVQLRSQNFLHEFYEGSGAKTIPDGQVVTATGAVVKGLCLLGRLSLGSVIAVDSINDCFGASAQRWAAGVIRRSQP